MSDETTARCGDLIPEEAIEAGARALTEITKRPWDDCLPMTREVLRRNARVPLQAAAPLILAAGNETVVQRLMVAAQKIVTQALRGEGDRNG